MVDKQEMVFFFFLNAMYGHQLLLNAMERKKNWTSVVLQHCCFILLNCAKSDWKNYLWFSMQVGSLSSAYMEALKKVEWETERDFFKKIMIENSIVTQ